MGAEVVPKVSRRAEPDAEQRLVSDAVEVIRATAPQAQPRVALIFGSGLGSLVEQIEQPARVPFASIPGFRGATVAGHRGTLVCGRLAGVSVAALAGRVHMYEGWSAREAAFPVRVLRALGADILFVSNAAGAINPSFRPGDLMTIDDHINLMWTNPLIGPVIGSEPRFPDMSEPYDRELRQLLQEAAVGEHISVGVGVYGGLLGPTYETPAEVRMLQRLGVDAVGMSTIPEVIVARALGMRVAGVSLITNAASGSTGTALSHAEVLEVAERGGERFRRLILRWLTDLGSADTPDADGRTKAGSTDVHAPGGSTRRNGDR